jgi:hypothetical protein
VNAMGEFQGREADSQRIYDLHLGERKGRRGMDYRFQCGQLDYDMTRLRVPRRNLVIYSELLVLDVTMAFSRSTRSWILSCHSWQKLSSIASYFLRSHSIHVTILFSGISSLDVQGVPALSLYCKALELQMLFLYFGNRGPATF